MLGTASASASKYQCLVMVLDSEFKRRFCNVLIEIGAFIRNCSRHTSLYFLLEDGDDVRFITWLANGKEVFENALSPDGLNQAIEKIIQLESMLTANLAFVSPMDSM